MPSDRIVGENTASRWDAGFDRSLSGVSSNHGGEIAVDHRGGKMSRLDRISTQVLEDRIGSDGIHQSLGAYWFIFFECMILVSISMTSLRI